MKPQPHHTPATVSEICLRAAEVIRERGWCQMDYKNDQGNVCTLGALSVAVGKDPVCTVDYLQIADSIGAMKVHLQLGFGEAIAHWNDKPGRTVEQVINALEETAFAQS